MPEPGCGVGRPRQRFPYVRQTCTSLQAHWKGGSARPMSSIGRERGQPQSDCVKRPTQHRQAIKQPCSRRAVSQASAGHHCSGILRPQRIDGAITSREQSQRSSSTATAEKRIAQAVSMPCLMSRFASSSTARVTTLRDLTLAPALVSRAHSSTYDARARVVLGLVPGAVSSGRNAAATHLPGSEPD